MPNEYVFEIKFFNTNLTCKDLQNENGTYSFLSGGVYPGAEKVNGRNNLYKCIKRDPKRFRF